MGRHIAIGAGVLAGLAAIALAAAPIISGRYATASLRDELAQMSDYNPAWQWRLQRLERGLFTSTAVVRQRPAGSQEGGFPWRLTIHHGPTVGNLNWVRVEAVPHLPDQVRQAVEALFQGQPPLTASLRIALDGNRYLTLHSPAVERGGRVPFTWKGLEATADLGKAAGQLRLDAEVPALRAGIGPNQVGLQGLTMAGDLHQVRPWVWAGWSKLDVDSFRVKAVNAETGARISFDLAGLSMESQSGADDGLLRSDGQWQVSSVFINTTPYRALETRWAIRNVDTETLQRLNELAMELEAGPQQTPGQVMAQLGERLDELPLDRFLAAEPSLNLKTVTVTTREGKLEGSGKLRFLAAEGSAAPIDPLIRQARARLRLSMPEPVLQRVVRSFTRVHASRLVAQSERFERSDLDWMAEALANRRIHELRQAGLVAADDGRITTRVRWDGQRLTVNGQPVADLQAALGSRPGPGQLGR
jgi:uncharacterized protein YdgA (DUF945 family)